MTEERIRRRAYQLYLLRGESFGDPLADWLAAERELRGARTLDDAGRLTTGNENWESTR